MVCVKQSNINSINYHNFIFIASDDDCMRNGVNTNTQTFNEANNPLTMTQAQLDARKANQVASNRGLHETYDYYHDCYIRSRNRGTYIHVLQ